MIGTIRDVIPIGAKTIITAILDVKAEEVAKYTGKACQFKIGLFRQRRSLSQNAYYWQLLTKVAAGMRTTTAFQHNRLLRQHPRFKTISGNNVQVWLRDGVEENVLEDMTLHLFPTAQFKTNSNGVTFRLYYVLRGSSEYNTEEMATLLDDLIADAKEAGIETLTPDELERMRAWEAKKETKAQGPKENWPVYSGKPA